ncbi:MAG TPA: hypothetical protein VKE69_13425 [Planctomycetota bacterium]|nr:hypothetical protein [Planctomycetota bacterium]
MRRRATVLVVLLVAACGAAPAGRELASRPVDPAVDALSRLSVEGAYEYTVDLAGDRRTQRIDVERRADGSVRLQAEGLHPFDAYVFGFLAALDGTRRRSAGDSDFDVAEETVREGRAVVVLRRDRARERVRVVVDRDTRRILEMTAARDGDGGERFDLELATLDRGSAARR